jgi:hypothetical protein
MCQNLCYLNNIVFARLQMKLSFDLKKMKLSLFIDPFFLYNFIWTALIPFSDFSMVPW